MGRQQDLESVWMEAVGLNPEGQKRRMFRMAHAIQNEWRATAQTDGRMKSTLAAYKSAIQIRDVSENSCTVELPGPAVSDAAPNVSMIARMLEFGMGPGGIGTQGPYDVRDFLLKGAKSRAVPFKYSTAMIKELGKLKNGGPGAKNTHDAAKELARTQVSSSGSWSGEKLSAGFTRISSNPNSRVKHKTDKLAGLRKMVGKDGQTSRYISFRTASKNQPKGKWQHRGIVARRLTRKVIAKLPQLWSTVA